MNRFSVPLVSAVVLSSLALPCPCLPHCGSTVWGELLRSADNAHPPYSAPYIVLAVVDSCQWREASESVIGSIESSSDFGQGEAYFLRFRPILSVKGIAPATPIWADTGFVRYAGVFRDFGEFIPLAVGDTVVTAASESLMVSVCSTVKIENGLIGDEPTMEVINAYRKRHDEH